MEVNITSFFHYIAYTLLVIIMNEIDLSKYENIINRSKSKPKKNYLKNLLIRIMIVIILFLSLAIAYKSNNNFKGYIDKYLYSDSIPFTKIKKFYNKYLGGILPKIKEENTSLVFNEKINYMSSEEYYDGVVLKVDSSYLVPAIEEGMVVFIGYKEHYGNTVIIESLEGVHYWYGNMSNISLKLYDYIEKGSFIGEASDNLYLVFSKDDKYLNYEEYIN